MARPSKSKWCNLDCFNCRYDDCYAPNGKKRSAWETQCMINVGLGKAERGGKRKGDMHV